MVRPPQPKPWLLSQDEVTLLKNSVCKGASDDELKFCLAVARRYELDPFRKEIHFVPRWDSQAERSDGKKGATIYVPVVGIDGLLHIAARDHADFGSYSEPEYGPMHTVKWADRYGKSGQFEAPEWARVECWKKGGEHATVGEVWWDEIYHDVSGSPTVRRMPRLMLAKCAKAQATRTAYPKTGGLLIPEETQTREFEDITPGGRIITEAAPAPALSTAEEHYLQREREGLDKLTPEQRKIVEERMKKASGAEPRRAEGNTAPLTPAETPAASNPSMGAGPQKERQNSPTGTTRPAPSKPEMVPAFFYKLTPSGLYEIGGGTDELKKANKDLLLPLWRANATPPALLATPEELGKLLSQLELRKVSIRELNG